mgnify:CR=1 FL=1
MTKDELKREVIQLLPQCVFKERGLKSDVVEFHITDDSLVCNETHPVEGSDIDNYSFVGLANIKIASDVNGLETIEKPYRFYGTFKEKDGVVTITNQIDITPR